MLANGCTPANAVTLVEDCAEASQGKSASALAAEWVPAHCTQVTTPSPPPPSTAPDPKRKGAAALASQIDDKKYGLRLDSGHGGGVPVLIKRTVVCTVHVLRRVYSLQPHTNAYSCLLPN